MQDVSAECVKSVEAEVVKQQEIVSEKEAEATEVAAVEKTITAQTGDAAAQPTLSKSQRKKLERQQRLAEHRRYCRAKQHEKRRLKRSKEKKQAREHAQSAVNTPGDSAQGESETKRARTEASNADTDTGLHKRAENAKSKLKPDLNVPAAIRVAFDCSFDAQMSEHDVRKLINQIGQAYGTNRKALCAAEMHICGMTGKLADLIGRRVDVHKWSRVWWHEKSMLDVFGGERNNLVYLTSDSETVLESLNPTDVYAIGGLVDHNRLKGVCFRAAQENGLRTARLPIGSNLRLASSSVLSVYHVFAILLRQLEVKDWRTALVDVIPKRKIKEVLNAGSESDSDSDSNDNDNDDSDDSENGEDEDGQTQTQDKNEQNETPKAASEEQQATATAPTETTS